MATIHDHERPQRHSLGRLILSGWVFLWTVLEFDSPRFALGWSWNTRYYNFLHCLAVNKRATKTGIREERRRDARLILLKGLDRGGGKKGRGVEGIRFTCVTGDYAVFHDVPGDDET